MKGLRRTLRPVDDPKHIDTLVARRCRIVAVSPQTTVFINGREAKSGSEIRETDVLQAVWSGDSSQAPTLSVTVEDE